MATVPPSTLQPHNSGFLHKPHAPLTPPRFTTSPFTTSPFTTRASADDSNSDSTAAESTKPSSSSPPGSDDFDSKLSQIRLRYRSGTGKKAEVRKTKKGKKTSSSSGGGVFLPPVPLKEPVSGGLKVDFGFSPYSERINGRIAGLGLAALLLVELATGKSVIRYHSPAIVFVQVYFVATVAALFVKYQKERVSVWPQSAPPPPNEE